MLWQIEIYPAEGLPDQDAQQVVAEAADLGINSDLKVRAARGYLLEGALDQAQAQLLADQLLADRVVERTIVAPVGAAQLSESANGANQLVYVLPKPGVMDPVAQSAQQAIADFDVPVTAVRTFHKYWIGQSSDDQLNQLCNKVLANDSVEQIVRGPLQLERLGVGSIYDFELVTIPLLDLNDDQLVELSRDGQLYLTLVEMQTIQQHFRDQRRDPTDVELETIAQTWSEHCSHKTLAGRIAYADENGRAPIRKHAEGNDLCGDAVTFADEWGADDWCVSVFEDNAGIIRFDDEFNVVFKVETHNHPSASGTLWRRQHGYRRRDSRPIGNRLRRQARLQHRCVLFRAARHASRSLPPGVLHPRRVMKGVVSGVRDYGNRMGIPTVNGAIYFDSRYLGNPLVYCGNVGILPRDKSHKQPQAGDLIVAIGGRTGRDGIHGATFSSAELTSESETLSGGAVQIGNAITEKMVHRCLAGSARPRLVSARSPIVERVVFPVPSAKWAKRSAPKSGWRKHPLKYEGLVLYRNLDLRSPRTNGPVGAT